MHTLIENSPASVVVFLEKGGCEHQPQFRGTNKPAMKYKRKVMSAKIDVGVPAAMEDEVVTFVRQSEIAKGTGYTQIMSQFYAKFQCLVKNTAHKTHSSRVTST